MLTFRGGSGKIRGKNKKETKMPWYITAILQLPVWFRIAWIFMVVLTLYFWFLAPKLVSEKPQQTIIQVQTPTNEPDSLECERQIKRLNADGEEVINIVKTEKEEIRQWAVKCDYRIKLGGDPFHDNVPLDEPPQPYKQREFQRLLKLMYDSKIAKVDSESNPKLMRIQADREYYQKRLSLLKPYDQESR
jgi:hypothetical protein